MAGNAGEEAGAEEDSLESALTVGLAGGWNAGRTKGGVSGRTPTQDGAARRAGDWGSWSLKGEK